jgi:hypothetical protein
VVIFLLHPGWRGQVIGAARFTEASADAEHFACLSFTKSWQWLPATRPPRLWLRLSRCLPPVASSSAPYDDAAAPEA